MDKIWDSQVEKWGLGRYSPNVAQVGTDKTDRTVSVVRDSRITPMHLRMHMHKKHDYLCRFLD